MGIFPNRMKLNTGCGNVDIYLETEKGLRNQKSDSSIKLPPILRMASVGSANNMDYLVGLPL